MTDLEIWQSECEEEAKRWDERQDFLQFYWKVLSAEDRRCWGIMFGNHYE